MREDNFLKKGNYEKNDTFVLQHRTCTHVENKIKAEHPKKFKLLCLRTCTLGFFEINIVALMCSSTFSTYNMPKNILNHYTTKKGRKYKKDGHVKQ